MKKHDMAKAISDRMDGITLTQIEDCVDTFFDVLVDALVDGDTYNQKNFGTFKRIDRAARKGRNPQTREMVDIPPSKALKVVVSSSLKDKLNA
jgi:DNA-binding protein HU-beta